MKLLNLLGVKIRNMFNQSQVEKVSQVSNLANKLEQDPRVNVRRIVNLGEIGPEDHIELNGILNRRLMDRRPLRPLFEKNVFRRIREPFPLIVTDELSKTVADIDADTRLNATINVLRLIEPFDAFTSKQEYRNAIGLLLWSKEVAVGDSEKVLHDTVEIVNELIRILEYFGLPLE